MNHNTAASVHELTSDVRWKGTLVVAFVWDVQANTVSVSDEWNDLLGHPVTTVNQFDPDAWREVIHPDDREVSTQMMADHLAGLIPYYESEIRFRHADGTWRWVLARQQITKVSASGEPLVVRGTAIDISSHKETKAELQESERRHRTVVDTLRDIVFQVDEDGRWALLNKAWSRITSLAVDECLGHDMQKFFHPDDAARCGNLFVQMTEGVVDVGSIELRLRHADGEYRWVEVDVRRDLDDRGRFTGVSGSITNVTMQRQTEAALRHRSQQLAAVIEAARVCTWEWDLDTNVGTFDDRWLEMLGFRPGEFPQGLPAFMSRVAPDDLPPLTLATQQLQSGQTVEFENRFRMRHKDGHWIWVEGRGRLTNGHASGHRVLAGITTEVTTQVETELALRRAHKMEAVGQIAGGIAHDFNNLLGIILGNAELLRARLDDDSEAKQRLDSIGRSATRAAALTKRLLGFARQNPKETAVVDINEMLTGVDALIGKALPSSIERTHVLASDLWTIEVDPGDLEDAVLNLVLNARDAMPTGGILTVATANRVIDPLTASRLSSRPTSNMSVGEFVELTVTDNGVGISTEIVDRVFDPYFTTRSKGSSGAGLGLSMVDAFARRSGGTAVVESDVGIGTTFRLLLPRSTQPIVKAAPVGPVVLADAASHKILVVDDEALMRDIASAQLERIGCQVVTASSGEDALDTLEHDTDIDLIFTDILMPGGIDGLELARLAVERHPHLKVLLTSGYMGVDGGRDNHGPLLAKPYSQSDLVKAVNELLGAAEPHRLAP